MPSTARPSAARDAQAATVLRVRRAVLGMTQPLEARISPDGRTVAVTVSGPGHTGVLLVPADGSAARAAAAVRTAAPVVPRRPDGSQDPAPRHSPRWLPDSRTLLLITGPRPGAAGRPELTAWDTRTGRLRTLVSVPGDVEDLLLSDDGTEVLLLVADEGAERDGMHLGLPVRLGPCPRPESFRPGDGRRRLLHGALPLPGAGATAATTEPVRLRDASPRGLTVWNAAWRGGTTAVATVSAETLPAGYYDARLVSVDLADGTTRTLHTPAGQLAAPAITADGRRAAVAEGISIVAGRPVLVDLADGTVTVSPGPEDTTWLLSDPRDPGRLLLAGWAGTGSRITGAPVDPGAPGAAAPTVHWQDEAVLSGPAAQPALTLSADGALAAAVLEAPGRPPQAVVAPTAGPDAWSWRQVTALNPAAARGDGDFTELARVRTRPTSWTSADSRRLHGLLLDAPGVPVPGAAPGPAGAAGTATTRPLAVLVHGGPSWLWSAGHAPADVLGLAPALAAAGWLVLLPNLRGSSGYGLDHARAVVGDFGGGDLADLLSAVSALTGSGEAAPGQAAVLGHSYGGYLAAVAAARTTAFRAAVVVSAPTDWLSFVHTSVIGGGYEYAYRIGDARTAAGRAALVDRSPVFADTGPGTGTPVLLLHGEQDRVTPVAQAHELYRALARRAAAPVELHVYPDEGHEFTEPGHLLDAAGRASAWLTRHVLGAAAPAALVPSPDRPADRGTQLGRAT